MVLQARLGMCLSCAMMKPGLSKQLVSPEYFRYRGTSLSLLKYRNDRSASSAASTIDGRMSSPAPFSFGIGKAQSGLASSPPGHLCMRLSAVQPPRCLRFSGQPHTYLPGRISRATLGFAEAVEPPVGTPVDQPLRHLAISACACRPCNRRAASGSFVSLTRTCQNEFLRRRWASLRQWSRVLAPLP